MADRRQNNDHDLIIRLDEKVDLLTRKVDDLTASTVNRIDILEKQVATSNQMLNELVKNDADKEARIRFIERYVWGAIAIIGLINLIGFGFLVQFLKH